jgi:hypothetical protein
MLRTLLKAVIVLAFVFLVVETFAELKILAVAQVESEAQTGAVAVDCFLPGQIRPLGSTTYVTRGRTIKTTQKECEARGGRPADPEKPDAEMPGSNPAKQDIHSPK